MSTKHPALGLFIVTVTTYVVALGIFILGWYISGPSWKAILCCLPLVLLIPAVIKRRRRYYQLLPNLLVVYIGWGLVERLINPEMAVFAGFALFLWVVCLIFMLKLVRTDYLIDGGHYISTRKKKS